LGLDRLRLLVGLLWKKEMQEDGGDKWIFQCRVDEEKNNPVNSTFFWGSMVINITIWSIFMVLNFLTFSFKNFIGVFPLFLNFVNFGSFVACSKGRLDFDCGRTK
jgi:hypothetical protein